jgi:predicted metal-binding protein
MKEKILAILAAAARNGAMVHEWGEIAAAELQFSPELLRSCATNACGHYNASWTCPPAAGTPEEQRSRILSYTTAFVFTTKHQLEDSFDYEGMTRGMELHSALTLELRERLGDFPVYGAGNCPYCTFRNPDAACTFPEPCPFPEKKVFSLEAAGINVTELSRAAGVQYHNGPDTVTYFSMVLYNEP